ncbi:MAG TPA: PilZ domain-containing protein [Candidatus Methylomirabilis sp.]|nr:PilZ domain-containing protein [Candidatus Methylomirabilis sp.]
MTEQSDSSAGGPVRDRSRQVGHRRYVRMSVSLPIIGRAAEFGERELLGMVRNIGGGGVMAEFPVWIVPGSVVHLTLQTPHGPVAFTGEVAWADPRGTPIAHGIAFREPHGDAFAWEFFQGEQGSLTGGTASED